MLLPKLNALPQTLQTLSTFGGLNEEETAPEGSWVDCNNMSARNYPSISTRNHMTKIAKAITDMSKEPYGMIGGEDLVLFRSSIESGKTVTDLYRITKDGNYEDMTSFARKNGFISFTPGKKKICRIGGNFLILPDKIIVEGHKTEDIYEENVETSPGIYEDVYKYNNGVMFHMCYPTDAVATLKKDTSQYIPSYSATVKNVEEYNFAATAPSDKTKVWYNTSDDSTYKWNPVTSAWDEFSDNHVEIQMQYQGSTHELMKPYGFKAGESVNFRTEDSSMITTTGSGSSNRIGQCLSLLGYHTLTYADNESGVYRFSGLIGGSVKLMSVVGGTWYLERKMPTLDYAVECKNRLWGCHYDGNINEIYASALGDLISWNKYDGLSTDSYAASVGTGADFTGAVNLNGNPVFFKSDRFYTVYVSSSGAHQIVETISPGVKYGFGDSVAIFNSDVYYMGEDGVYKFSGSYPTKVSPNIHLKQYESGVAGISSENYILTTSKDSSVCTYVYNTVRRIWHKWSGFKSVAYCTVKDVVYFLNEKGELYTAFGEDSYLADRRDYDHEGKFDWYAETGMIGYTDGRAKRIARVTIRADIPDGSCMKVYVRYDDNQYWEEVKEITSMLGSAIANIKPRRCDHFRYKIVGNGDCRIYTISKYYERASIRP